MKVSAAGKTADKIDLQVFHNCLNRTDKYLPLFSQK